MTRKPIRYVGRTYKMMQDAYTKGREEAISEFADKLLCLVSNNCKFIITKDCTYYAMEQEEIDKLIYETVEEMKEQNNER